MVPLCDLQQQYFELKHEIDQAMQAVAASGQYILGPNVAELEREVAGYCGCEYAVGVNSGTDALHLALMALRIGPGDEVISTPFTFIASSEAIRMVGATPVFVDVDPRTYNLDPQRIAAAITPRTKAILPVHLFGQPCDMDSIMQLANQHSLAVVEDCCQAIGATYYGKRVGTFGAAGCMSFFPSKNLGCFGDGGMVVTNDRSVYERIGILRRHGGRVKYHHELQGVNSRLDELQAALLRVKLRHLDAWTNLRRVHAYRYNCLLAATPSIERPAEKTSDGTAVVPYGETTESPIRHVYHQYTVAVDDRDLVARRLSEENIGCAVYYPLPLHRQQVNADLGYPAGALPIAESISRRCLSLPMYPELQPEQQDLVVDRLRPLVERRSHSGAAA